MDINESNDIGSLTLHILHSPSATGISKLIRDTLNEVNPRTPNELAKAKTELSVTLSQLVDAQQFSGPSTPPLPLAERARRTIDSQSPLVKKAASSTRLGTPQKSLSSTKSFDFSRRERASFSQFGMNTHSMTFNKAKRATDLLVPRTPGPAQYSSFRSSLKKNPSAMIPTEKTERFSLSQAKGTPGPSDYYPAMHFIAK